MARRVVVTWDEHELQVVRYSEVFDIPDDINPDEVLDYARERAGYEDRSNVRYSETEHTELISVRDL